MAITAANDRAATRLRLVVDNSAARAVLTPILELERRLAEVERLLAEAGTDGPDTAGRDAAGRATLLEVRTLLRCELDARPFNPRLARRCEQRLRWIERQVPAVATVAAAPGGLLARARRVLMAILPEPMARA